MKKKLSICIPTYNREGKLRLQIQFLLNELSSLDAPLRDLVEIIVSDNASTDGTAQFMNGLFHNNVQYYCNKENEGIVANAYKVVGYADGEFIWVVGDDDILNKGVLGRVFEIIYEYPNLNFIYLNHLYIDGDKISDSKCYRGGFGFYKGVYPMISRQDFYLNSSALGLTASVVFKRKIVMSVIDVLPLDQKMDYGWSFIAGLYGANLGNGFFEKKVWLYDQMSGKSWTDYMYTALYGSLCSTMRLLKLGFSIRKVWEICHSFGEIPNLVDSLLEEILISGKQSSMAKKLLIALLIFDTKHTISEIFMQDG